jgi:hypothetical protein
VEPIQSFSLEKHSGPYEAWARKTRLYFDGADTGATVSGYVIDGQYRAGGCYLLIVSYDCPYEESNDFLLLNAAFEIIAESSLTPPMYASYLLDTHWPVSASEIRLHYYHSEIYEIGIEGNTSTDGKGCRLTVKQIDDYQNDERSANAVVDLQMRLAHGVNAGNEGDGPTLDTWRRAWTELGATHCDDHTLRSLILAYEGPERASMIRSEVTTNSEARNGRRKRRSGSVSRPPWPIASMGSYCVPGTRPYPPTRISECWSTWICPSSVPSGIDLRSMNGRSGGSIAGFRGRCSIGSARQY